MSETPLRIDWELAQPWVPTAHGIHLDGLVASVIVERALGLQGLPPDARWYDDLTRELPFAQHEAGGRSCWKASLVVPHEILSSERQLLTTKTPVEAIARWTDEQVLQPGRRVVDTERGYFKAGLIYYPLQHVHRVSAWCVGDPDVLSDLLSDIRSIGPKGRLGHGALKLRADGMSFTMTEDPAAHQAWQIRNLPAPREGHFPMDGALTTPYWRKDRHQRVYPPLDPIAMAQPYLPPAAAAVSAPGSS